MQVNAKLEEKNKSLQTVSTQISWGGVTVGGSEHFNVHEKTVDQLGNGFCG